MAFRKKAGYILKYRPDLVIVPECENEHRLKFNMFDEIPTDIVWYGDNPNKGLGVFSYSDFRLKLHDWHNPEFKTILPIAVENSKENFTLFAIWANNKEDRANQYVGQIWQAINYYEKFLNDKKVILMGDFNSNTIWDLPRREGNHTTVVDFLRAKDIHSTYHEYYKMEQGKEKHTTLYMHRYADRPYHIDYCFVSKYYLQRLKRVIIGDYKDWKDYSDHMPVIVHF